MIMCDFNIALINSMPILGRVHHFPLIWIHLNNLEILIMGTKKQNTGYFAPISG